MTSVRLFLGKGEFVRRTLADGSIEQICECIYNADFTDGCISQVCAELLPEVVANNGHYATKENLRKYRRARKTNNRCIYCYATRYNGGRVTPKSVDFRTEGDFQEFKPEFVRLGKRTESGHPYYFPVLRDFLDILRKRQARFIFPDKMFPYGREGAEGLNIPRHLIEQMPSGYELARMLADVCGVINYSIGNDRFEPGAVSQGFTNEWRISQALLYRQAGLNSTLTVTCDVTSSLDDNEKRGFAVKQALAQRAYIPVRLLPFRINSGDVAVLATGRSWEDIVYSPSRIHRHQGVLHAFQDLHSEVRRELEKKPYEKRDNNELVPRYLHPDFQALVDEGIGVCGRVGDYEYCDKCNLQGGTRIMFPISELAEVTYVKLNKGRERMDRRRRMRDKTTRIKW